VHEEFALIFIRNIDKIKITAKINDKMAMIIKILFQVADTIGIFTLEYC